MFDFVLQFGLITHGLSDILQIKFLPESRGQKSMVGKGLQFILELHNKGNYLQRDIELARANMFLKHLNEIKENQPELFRRFKSTIVRHGSDPYAFFGFRFELNIAASLFRKGIIFHKQETPDFVLSDEFNKIGIECSSVRTRKLKKRPDLNFKVAAKIFEKSKRKYSTTNTLLFLDATNIAHQLNNNRIQLDFNVLKYEINKSNQDCIFDGILVFTYVYNQALNRLESDYIRVDPPSIPENSKAFLDQFYPMGKHPITNPGFPWEG
jgi:hypothetical protein